jgi:hypothetical protein
MTTMAVTAVRVAQQVAQQVALQRVMTVSLIGLHTVLSAVIPRGTSMVLTVRHLNLHTVGTALDVAVLVTVRLSVVTATVLVTKHMRTAQLIALSLQDVKTLVVISWAVLISFFAVTYTITTL